MAKINALAVLCILGAALVAVKAEYNKEEMLKTFMARCEECMKETGAAAGDIQDFINKKPASTHEGKCMRACVMKKYGVMTADGKFSREGALEKARMMTNDDAEKMKMATEIVDKCIATPVGGDECENAEAYGKCFKDEMTARNIPIE